MLQIFFFFSFFLAFILKALLTNSTEYTQCSTFVFVAKVNRVSQNLVKIHQIWPSADKPRATSKIFFWEGGINNPPTPG